MLSKILSLGASYFEITSINFPLPDTLTIETETVGKEYIIDPGGSAIYFARVSASLGLSPIFIGKRGKDYLGEQLEEMLEEFGITPSYTVSDEVQTNVAINYVRPDGKTLMFVSGSANQALEHHEVESKILDSLVSVNYLYLGGGFKLLSLLPMYADVIKKAKESGVKVIIDHGRVNTALTPESIATMKDAIARADYYLPSKDELLAVWEAESIEHAIKKVREVSAATIVVKDSENGAYGSIGDEIVHCKAFEVVPKNTVGAGDSFNAGFIRAQIEGMDLYESLRFGCATAALKISEGDLPAYDKVIQICQTS